MCKDCGCQTALARGQVHAHTHEHADGVVHSHPHDHGRDHGHQGAHDHAHPPAPMGTSEHVHVHEHAGGMAHDHPHEHEHGHEHGATWTVPLEHRVLDRNDRIAAENRAWLAERRVVALNLISSPGTGKTLLLERTLERIRDRVPCAVIAGDQYTDNDKRRLDRTGVPSSSSSATTARPVRR